MWLSAGEAFDLSCPGGVCNFHSIRTNGGANPGVASSIHLRLVDFEYCCSSQGEDKGKDAFEAQTRWVDDDDHHHHHSLHNHHHLTHTHPTTTTTGT